MAALAGRVHRGPVRRGAGRRGLERPRPVLQGLLGGVVQPVLPKEGTVTQINTINLAANSPHTAAAQKFIDYAIGAKAQKAFDEAAFYAPVNRDVRLSPAVKNRTAASDVQRKNQIPIDWDWLTTRYTAWVDRIKQEVISG
ncbi:hypothetical protein CGL27_01675 [Streptomyces sp. 11-1-2]|nr:hypothetical protein CGL27_01675 [Streptomyces sp. 11-1-2]